MVVVWIVFIFKDYFVRIYINFMYMIIVLLYCYYKDFIYIIINFFYIIFYL